MYRITSQRAAESIAAGIAMIPEPLRARVRDTHFMTENPLFVGLHRVQRTQDGRSYALTGHHVAVHNQRRHPAARRHPTIVLPGPTDWLPWVVVHELGHALDFQLGREPILPPCTKYAHTNRMEAFAEAFTAWVLDTQGNDNRWNLVQYPEIRQFFDALNRH